MLPLSSMMIVGVEPFGACSSQKSAPFRAMKYRKSIVRVMPHKILHIVLLNAERVPGI